MENKSLNSANLGVPIFLDFQQIQAWISYIVRTQTLAKYVISSSAAFLTFLLTITKTIDINFETDFMFFSGFSLIVGAVLLSSMSLLRLMSLEAALCERAVQDNTDIDLNERDFKDTYWVRRSIALSYVLLFAGIFLFLLKLTFAQNL